MTFSSDDTITVRYVNVSGSFVELDLSIGQSGPVRLCFWYGEAKEFVCTLLTGTENVTLTPEGHKFYDFLS